MVLVLVTGANKGIGLEIARLLGATEDMQVILGARDAKLGEAAAAQLKAEGCKVEFHQLDIADAASIEQIAAHIEKQGGLDVLVNNAGMAYKGNTFGVEEAKITIDVNLKGTANLTHRLVPLMKNRPAGARIVNVASRAGKLGQLSPELQARFASRSLTYDGTVELTDEFVAAIAAGDHREKGWSSSMYGVSKLAMIAHGFVLARELAPFNISVTSMCPGYCKTDMTSQKGYKTAAEGADTAVWLATQPKAPSTGFYGERRGLDWKDPTWE